MCSSLLTRLPVKAGRAQILQSAIHYCQMAGLVVNLDTTPDGLRLTLPDAAHEMTPEGAHLRLHSE